MSEQSSNVGTIMAILFAILVALGAGFFVMTQRATSENWKQRWDEDTAQLTVELKKVTDMYNAEAMRARELERKLAAMTPAPEPASSNGPSR
jgi:hypothetical protein